jgi:ADP-L-glycero-D-manno-heptose 6-epimerase
MILVTGGAGFIGSNIAAALAARAERVTICDRFGAGDKWRNLAKHALHDVVAPEELSHWLERHADDMVAIVHMGAISSTTETDVDLILRENVALSIRLWDFARERGIAFIYASSAATYGDGAQGFSDDPSPQALARLAPLNPYGWSKHVFDRRIARDVAERRPLPRFWAGLKFFNVYGPNEYHKGAQRSVVHQIFEQVRDKGDVRLFQSHRDGIEDGGQMRDFVYVSDCVDVVLWLLDNEVSGLFNLGTGQARSFLDLAKATFAAMELTPNISFIPTPEALRAHYQYWTQADMTRLRQVGYSAPFMSLEEGVRDYVRGYLMQADRYS